MRKLAFMGWAVLLAAQAAWPQIYRWVDEDGVVHYADTPHPGAEEVVLPDSPPPPPVQPERTFQRAALEPANEQAPFHYESLSIAQPAAEETLWNIEGVLNVSVDLQPALQPGHELRVYFDGQPQSVGGSQFQLQEVWRGEHNLQAEVVDETGQAMIRSQPTRFYVQQTTIVNPKGNPVAKPKTNPQPKPKMN
jgi:hypothetical protein